MNLLSQAAHMNPVNSLIENYFAIWLCGDTSCPSISSPDITLNLFSQATHLNPVCSLFQNYDTSCPAISTPDVKLNHFSQATHMNPVRSLIQNCSAKWLCCDTSWPTSWPEVQMSNWTFCRSPHNEILFALWFKATTKLNLLPQSSQWNPTCSMIQSYSSKWLCGDETSLVSNFKTRCQIEPFAAVFTMKSCLLFDSKLLFKTTLWWWN